MAHKDPVLPEVAEAVFRRDRTCAGPKVGMPGACGNQWGSGKAIHLELDHVNSAGFGKRGPSIEENLVVICGYHHRIKTEASRQWRAAINEYLMGFYGS